MPQRWGKDTAIKFYGGQIDIRLSADKSESDYTKDLQGIVRRSKNMKRANERVIRYLLGSFKRSFEAEGRPAWEALADSTISDRRRQGYGDGPILVRTGALKDAVTKEGSPGQVIRAMPRSLIFKVTLDYFAAHQYGTPDIPQRQMIILQKQDKSQISRIYNRYVLTGKA